MKTLTTRAHGRRFGGDERGNVAMMVALAIVPLTVASLGAVDLTRSIAGKVELQDALDAAALAAGRSSTQDAATLQQLGDRILRQNLAGVTDFTLASSSFTLGDNGKIVAQARATYQPSFTLLAGGQPSEITAATEVQRANSILEIALVLDNTGSMGDPLGKNQNSKLSYLKTAASKFVDLMDNAARQSTISNSIRISLVPFSNVVNVGATYKTADWIDQNGASPINDEIFTTKQGGPTQHANRFDLFKALNTSWGGCVEARKAPYDIQDTEPSTTNPATLFTPYFAPDEQDNLTDSRGNPVSNSYVTDPDKDANKNKLDQWGKQGSIAKYGATNVTLDSSRGPNAGCALQPIHRLSSDFSGLKSSINNMVAHGNTDIPLGLAWGWHTLSPGGPFGDGVAYLKPKYKKIVVLMTDGENTMSDNNYTINQSNYSSRGYVWQGRVLQESGQPLVSLSSSADTRTAALDSRLKKLCTAMKAPDKSVEIYTVGVGVSTASKTLLKGCASAEDHYFDVTAGSDLTTAFQNIANQIAQLHLSK